MAMSKTAKEPVQSTFDTSEKESRRPLTFPYVPDAYRMFQNLETASITFVVDEALMHPRAGRAFVNALRNESSPERQVLITQVLLSKTKE